MDTRVPAYYKDVENCVDDLVEKVGRKIVMAAPLALAKPAHLINALYARTKRDPNFHFTLLTAVSLEKPTWSGDLEKRFLKPLVDRIWEGVPDFDYVLDMRKNQAPGNFELIEFFNKAAGWINNAHAKQNYLGSNYTHAVRDAMINQCNVLCQLVAKREINGRLCFSMGSNPDTHLEGGRAMEKKRDMGERVAAVAQVNPNMPFMYGQAVVEPDFYDMVIDSPRYDSPLFGAPKEPVSSQDWMIGLNASTLVRDGGTLQVGIGSLGDAIVAGIDMRHRHNDVYRFFVRESGVYDKFHGIIDRTGGMESFEKGLLGSSEMLVDTLIDLFESGIIKRKVYEDRRLQRVINENRLGDNDVEQVFRGLVAAKQLHTRIKPKEFEFLKKFGIFRQELNYERGYASDGHRSFSLDTGCSRNCESIIENCLGSRLENGVALYASFFIGPQRFYNALINMDEDKRKLIDMRGVDYVNQLYGDEELKRLQRQHGRFINAGLMVTLSGAVVADGLEENRIVSGPGGQYNFVSMAHELEDGRAVTMIRSTRGKGKNLVSNVVWQYGHVTIPRHLRDMVVTEYGIADLRGKKDWEVMTALICIADSRFQPELLDKAKANGNIPRRWEIPERFKNNFPETVEAHLERFREKGFFSAFPFGTDLTHEEIVLGRALKLFRQKKDQGVLAVLPELIRTSGARTPEKALPYLERMALHRPSGIKERVMQKIVLAALGLAGAI
ncbi:MAG: acetyl-CoA hydrolase/transferase C-terminal domain-containing protein [Desulfobacteraceae bacterium]